MISPQQLVVGWIECAAAGTMLLTAQKSLRTRSSHSFQLVSGLLLLTATLLVGSIRLSTAEAYPQENSNDSDTAFKLCHREAKSTETNRLALRLQSSSRDSNPNSKESLDMGNVPWKAQHLTQELPILYCGKVSRLRFISSMVAASRLKEPKYGYGIGAAHKRLLICKNRFSLPLLTKRAYGAGTTFQ